MALSYEDKLEIQLMIEEAVNKKLGNVAVAADPTIQFPPYPNAVVSCNNKMAPGHNIYDASIDRTKKK